MLHWQETITRLLVAALLGGLVGIERQRQDWAAGLRTHMLVCLGSTLTMIVSSFGFSDILGTPNVSLDPSRVAAQVISGIGFLGAGTILFMKHQEVRGLTTAAGLWTVAAIGLAVGGGLYLAAAVTTLLVLLILVVAKPYKKRLIRQYQAKELYLIINRGQDHLKAIAGVLEEHKLIYTNINVQPGASDKDDTISIRLRKESDSASCLAALESLRQLTGIRNVNLKNNS